MVPKLDYMKDELIKMYQSGMSLGAIAKQIGEYPQAVATTLDKYIERKKRKDYDFDRSYFSVIDSEDKAYFLGFIAADGALVDNGRGVLVMSISINEKDVSVLESFKECLKAEHPVYPVGKQQVRFNIANKQFTSDLMNLGIEQRKSLTMGPMLQYVPDEYRKDFIRGYFDGDGSIFSTVTSGKQVRHYASIRGTEAFLEDLKEYLGLGGYISKDSECPQWRFGSKADIAKFRDIIYDHSNFYLARKKDKFPW